MSAFAIIAVVLVKALIAANGLLTHHRQIMRLMVINLKGASAEFAGYVPSKCHYRPLAFLWMLSIAWLILVQADAFAL